MRILSFNSPYGAGGIGQHAAQLVEETRAKGQLHYYFSNRPKAGDEKGRMVGISTLGALRYTPLRFSPSWKSYLSNELFDEAVARRLDGPVDRFMGLAGKTLRSFRQARRLGAQLLELVVPNSHIVNVYALHQRAARDTGIRDTWLNKAQVRKTLGEYALADRIYTHSAYTEQSLLARGIPREKLRRTHLTVDERFEPPDERPDDNVFRIAYVGRVDATKGVPLLLEAFKQVPIPRKRLHIMGGWSTRAMRKLMEGYMTDERITVGPGDPLPLLKRADVFVHPTYEDGFGYAPMEALACGVPVIATEDTGMKEYVQEGENGYVVPAGSTEAIAEALMHVSKSPLATTRSLLPASAPYSPRQLSLLLYPMASNDFPLRAFFGHHKCATSWIDQILMEMCFHMGLHLEIVHRPVKWVAHGSLRALVEAAEADLVAYTNATMEHIADLPFTRAFHVVRDPRDILVSAYFSHLKTHPTQNWPELRAHRAHLSTLSKEEGLFAEMDFSAGQFEDMYTWDYDQPEVLEFKLEELSPAPFETFTAIMRHLQLLDDQDDGGVTDLSLRTNRWLYRARHIIPQALHPPRLIKHHVLPQHALDDIIEMKSFKKLSGGRKRGEEDASSHFRKGQPGDWANHFSDEHKAAFKERFNHVLVKLGYEDDDAW